MSRILFAERFLTKPAGLASPEPDHYDASRGYSVTADGRPFVEAGSAMETRTFTEADGEASDDDRDRVLKVATKTSAPGEPSDRHALTADGQPIAVALLETRTMTFTDAEGADDDRDRGVVRATAYTDARADGERPDRSAWGLTETAVEEERPDEDRSVLLSTMTKADGERDD